MRPLRTLAITTACALASVGAWLAHASIAASGDSANPFWSAPLSDARNGASAACAARTDSSFPAVLEVEVRQPANSSRPVTMSGVRRDMMTFVRAGRQSQGFADARTLWAWHGIQPVR